MLAVLYLRVSSDLQADADRYGLEAQRSACLAYAARTGLKVVAEYQDVVSGTADVRDGFTALLSASGQHQAVIVYAVDRLARSVPVAYGLLAALQATGAALHSALEGPLDLQDDNAALSFGIRAVLADAERRRITTRMYAGKLAKARSGQTVRPLNGFGWKDGQPDEEQARWARWIFDELETRGLVQVSDDLRRFGVPTASGRGQWGKGQLLAMVRNPAYKGLYEFGRKGERIQVQVPALVTPEQWARVNAAVASRYKNSGRAGSMAHVYQLTGVARCAQCDKPMSGAKVNKASGVLRYYHCRGIMKSEGKICTHNTYYPLALLHQVVQDGLAQLMASPALIAEALARGAAATPAAPGPDWSAEVARLDGEWERWKGALRAGAITPEELAVERRRIDAARAALPTAQQHRPLPDAGAWLEQVRGALEGLPLHEALRAAGVRVTVAPGGAVTLLIRP